MTIERFAREFLEILDGALSRGTLYLYSICFRHFITCVGDKPLKLVRTLDVERFKADRLKNVSAVRVNIEFRTLKAAFSRAVKWGLIDVNPFASSSQVKVPFSEPSYLSREDFALILGSTIEEKFREILIFAVLTMMRLGEILSLEWADVDMERQLIHVRNKMAFVVKGGKPRTIPMSKRVHDVLSARENREGLVFATPDGSQRSTRSISRRFKRLVRTSGISEKIHFHSLRHTGASWLAQMGVPLFEIQKILGHSSPLVTQIYSHLADENLKRAVEKINWN
ncbi:MAG: tyrosine-type recombinase/integrase [Bacteroidota bacterium]